MRAMHREVVFRIAKCTDEDKLVIVLALIVLIGAFIFQSHTSFAATTSTRASHIPLSGYCNNPSPHCYAEQSWIGGTPGAYTQIEPYGRLTCGSCNQYDFETNEMWFADNSSSQCTSTAYKGCWVESGIASYASNHPNDCNQGTNSLCAYWADNRPGTGGYHEHTFFYFGPSGTDLTPYYMTVAIVNGDNSSGTGSNWIVYSNIYNASNVVIGNTNGTSTNNTMSPTYITIGSELAEQHPSGTGGPSAGDFYFAYNEWKTSSGSWPYQTTPGVNESTNPPPFGQWAPAPCSNPNCSGNIGGVYHTWNY